MKDITKIVLTGGPCAGKTSAQGYIRNAFEAKDYAVFFVPECATILIDSGVDQTVCGGYDLFEQSVLYMQEAFEKCYMDTAEKVAAEKVLIVCDRGKMDVKAFVSEEVFNSIVKQSGLDEEELRLDYDAVFHLTTAAKGAEKFYSTENNSARIETVEQAIENDNRIMNVWSKHPHFTIIENRGDFETKMRDLVSAIDDFLNNKNDK